MEWGSTLFDQNKFFPPNKHMAGPYVSGFLEGIIIISCHGPGPLMLLVEMALDSGWFGAMDKFHGPVWYEVRAGQGNLGGTHVKWLVVMFIFWQRNTWHDKTLSIAWHSCSHKCCSHKCCETVHLCVVGRFQWSLCVIYVVGHCCWWGAHATIVTVHPPTLGGWFLHLS